MPDFNRETDRDSKGKAVCTVQAEKIKEHGKFRSGSIANKNTHIYGRLVRLQRKEK